MPQGPPARTVGARLREAREKRGVSLRQVASSTRISLMSLEALERSDLSRLPGGIFTRAFVRAYAQEVGLDPDRTIQEFIAELPPESIATARTTVVEDGEKLESDRLAVATALRLVLVSVPIIGLVIYYGAQSRSAGHAPAAQPVAESISPATEAPAVPAATGSTAPITDAPVAPPSRGEAVSALSLELTPNGACWISVTSDGKRVFAGLLNAGERRAVSANEYIVLNAGDGAACRFSVNGRPGKPLGAPGQLAIRRITRANLREFTLP